MSELLTEPWPWWIGGPAFAVVAMLIWVVERRLLGVSGSYRQISTRESRSEREALDALARDPNALNDAMLQAAIAEFGEEAVRLFGEAAEEEQILEEQRANEAKKDRKPSLPRAVHFTFLLALIAGGVLGGLASGGPFARWSMGSVFEGLFGAGPTGIAVLFVGGVCIGFGTRMAGGCTSGHGLVGCSRFQSGSLLATAVYFGVGALVSLSLGSIMGWAS